MTDLDVRLRELAHELVLDRPDVQPLDDLGAVVRHLDAPTEPARAGRRVNGPRALVAAAVVVLVAVALIAVVDRVESQRAGQPPGKGPCRPDPGSFTGPDGSTFGQFKRKNTPDFVRVTCPGRGGVFGWARSSDVLSQLAGPTLDSLAVNGPAGTAMCDASGADVGTLQTSPRYPVFADDGITVIGHIYPPIGYRPLGKEPRYYPDRNGLRPCNGDVTALPTQPASSKAQLAWPGAVNHDVDYASYRSMVGLSDPPDPQGYGNKYITMADMVRRGAAHQAKLRGEPYNPADLLWPLRDAAGRIREYQGTNMLRSLTPAQVRAPDFDLCRFQVADAKKRIEMTRRRVREHPEMFRVPELPGQSAEDRERARQQRIQQELERDPAESVGCKKA
jgi:hypothetical protein